MTQNVLIIGGGIAGPALALFLNKAGICSTVFEAYPHVDGALTAEKSEPFISLCSRLRSRRYTHD